MVVVSRSAVGLRTVLTSHPSHLEERHQWVATRAIEIDLLPVGEDQNHDRWFNQAASKFAEILKMAVPDFLEQSHPGQQELTEPFLILQAKALLRSVRDFARKEWPLRGSPADVLM